MPSISRRCRDDDELIACALAAGVRRLDFLRGNKPYKYQWGATDEPIQRVLVRRREGSSVRTRSASRRASPGSLLARAALKLGRRRLDDVRRDDDDRESRPARRAVDDGAVRALDPDRQLAPARHAGRGGFDELGEAEPGVGHRRRRSLDLAALVDDADGVPLSDAQSSAGVSLLHRICPPVR